MAEAGKSKKGDDESLYTLTEVSQKTSISMPTLQRYKKSYQSRIPSVGKGRKQRYPEAALPVFEEIKQENIKRRGRPPKKGKAAEPSKRAAKKSTSSSGSEGGLLTLTKIAEETGISYPTLVRYVKLHGKRIPSEGTGRSRRYHPEAIEVFKQLRAESPRGRRKKKSSEPKATRGTSKAAASSVGGGSLDRRVKALEQSQSSLEKQIRELIKHLKKPLKLTINR